MKKLERILKKHGNQPSFLIPILQDIQAEYNYLPQEVLEHLSRKIGIPLSGIYSTATFFKAFSLKPRGKHLITVCLGTACHVRKGTEVLEHIERILNIKTGDTSQDGQFTLEAVNCLGCCAIGPIVVIDGTYFGKVTLTKVSAILKNYAKD